MVGLFEVNLEALHAYVDFFNLEDVLVVMLVSSRHLHPEGETIARQKDVQNASVSDAREARFALNMVADITKVHLNASDFDIDGVLVLVGNLLASPAPVVVAANLENVGHKVVALQYEVLNNGIELGIRILDAGNGDVGHILHDGWNNDLCQIFDQVRLEGSLSILIIT